MSTSRELTTSFIVEESIDVGSGNDILAFLTLVRPLVATLTFLEFETLYSTVIVVVAGAIPNLSELISFEGSKVVADV